MENSEKNGSVVKKRVRGSQSLINKKHVRDYALRRVKEIRPEWNVTSISGTIIQDLDFYLKRKIDGILRAHRSNCKTISDFH